MREAGLSSSENRVASRTKPRPLCRHAGDWFPGSRTGGKPGEEVYMANEGWVGSGFTSQGEISPHFGSRASGHAGSRRLRREPGFSESSFGG